MSIEMSLLAKVMKTGELLSVLEFGIGIQDFLSAEGKSLFDYIVTYYRDATTQGAVPTPAQLAQKMSGFVPPVDSYPNHPLGAVCTEMRCARVRVESAQFLTEYLEKSKSLNATDLQRELGLVLQRTQGLLALGTSANTDTDFTQGLEALRKRMEQQQAGLITSVAEFPWSPVQDITMGIQPDDFIVFYGRPKQMKTWLLIALLASCFEQEKKVLIYTKEMSKENIFARMAACLLHFRYDDIRLGQLTQEQWQSYYALMTLTKHPIKGELLRVLSAKDAHGGDTVSWLAGKIDRYKPDVAFVDGMYLMADEQSRKGAADHTRVMNVSRALRQIPLSTGVPIVATIQANRKAAGHNNANLDEIAYSDAVSQDATIAARVIKDTGTPTLSVVIGGSREFQLDGFRINAIPAVDFGFHSLLTEADAEKVKEADNLAAEKAASPDGDKKDAAKKKGVNGHQTNGHGHPGGQANGHTLLTKEFNRIMDQQIRSIA